MPEHHPHHSHEPDRHAPRRGERLPTPAPRSEAERELEAANQSLADALRWSFRLLSAIMVFVLVGFLFSGVRIVQPQQAGVKKVFGAVTGVAREGLAFNWPYPVGEIIIVNIQDQSLDVEDFWMHLRADDRTRPLDEVKPESMGLRPGWDGALFTGDRNLLHMRAIVTYRIRDAVRYLQNIEETNVEEQRDLRLNLRCLASKAALRAAAHRTADSIKSADKALFNNEVTEETQRQLNLLTMDRRLWAQFEAGLQALPLAAAPEDPQLREQVAEVLHLARGGRWDDARAAFSRLRDVVPASAAAEIDALGRTANELFEEAIEIVSVSTTLEWPLRAREAYRSAQRAVSDRQTRINTAIGQAQKILRETAGDNYRMLVGEPFQGELASTDPNLPYDLIGQYGKARDAGDPARSNQLLEQIETVLVRQDTEGEVSRIIRQARARQDAYNEPLKAWHKRFTDVLPQYRQTPEMLLSRHWTDVREYLLGQSTNEKYTINPGEGKTVLKISRPPEMTQDIQREKNRRTTEKATTPKAGRD